MIKLCSGINSAACTKIYFTVQISEKQRELNNDKARLGNET